MSYPNSIQFRITIFFNDGARLVVYIPRMVAGGRPWTPPPGPHLLPDHQ